MIAKAKASATVANQPAFDQGGFPIQVLELIAGHAPAWETLTDTVEITAKVEKGSASNLAIQIHIENHVPERTENPELAELTQTPSEHTAGRLILDFLQYFEPALLERGISAISLQLKVTKGISVRGTGLGSSGATPAAALRAMLSILSGLELET